MSFLKMFSKGFRSSLETSPIDNGTFKVATDTKQLFVDLDGERIELSDVVKGLTESEILDILAPLPKLYLSSDTNKLYNYTTDGWAPVNKNEFIGTRVAVLQAIEDGIIQEGATIYITDDYTGDGADLSIYCTYEYANENLVTKGELSEVTNPEYTKATSVSELSSGELLSVAFGKLSKAIADYISHKADTISHITSAERSKWNAKLGTSDVVNNATSTDTSKPLSANMGKSLQDQISILNSNKIPYSKIDMTILDVDTDLNNITTPNIYRTYKMENACIVFANCPTKYKMFLIVQKYYETIYQTIYPMNMAEDANVYKRTLCDDIWSDWIVIN